MEVLELWEIGLMAVAAAAIGIAAGAIAFVVVRATVGSMGGDER